MNRFVKRTLSAVLVVMLCISLLSGLSFAATVNYQTGNPEGFENVILNWGKRGTTATYLSPNAISFYENNNVTYSELASLKGYFDTGLTPTSPLYLALQELMTRNHTVITSYADTRPLYSYTDCQEGDRDKLTCFYSGISIGPDWDSGATWNREHTWPNSKGMEGDDENDIMMLRPASTSVNSSRGNKAYGESEGFFDPNTVSKGAYDLHGDVARIMLYVYVRWGNLDNAWGSEGMIENQELLLDWMEQDPVDTWEMGRNDSVESITGTRNVFVDYPELAFKLFDSMVPTDMTTPSGEAINSGSAYTITAQSGNSAHGTVSLSGNTINAFPAVGYRAAGYTVLSGTAVVTRNGNTFTVNASSDCTVQINFEAKKPVSLTFSENGTEVSSTSVYQEDRYTMPQLSGTAPEGYSFQGWVTDPLAETAVKPGTIYIPGQALTAEADTTYYALYSRLDATGTGGGTAYELFSGDLQAGSYVITYDNGAMTASVTKDRLDITEVTPVDDSINEPDGSIIWDIAFTDDGYVTIYNKATSSYAGGTGAKNKANLLSSVTDYAKWTPSFDGGYEFVNLGNEAKGVNKTLRRNADFGFACYATATGGALTLYKQSSGTVYYSTTAAACKHVNTRTEAALEPTCTEAGYTEGVYCEDCQSWISGHEDQAATGHDYVSKVTPPTVTDQGYTTYTCSVCGDKYIGDYIDALGEQYTVSFVVPQGVASIEPQLCGKAGITLPTAGVPESETAYTFVGWTTGSVADTDTVPTILTGNYIAESDTTLYALYSYVTGASGSMEWKLVTDAASLAANDLLVLASNQKGKVAADIYSQYLTSVDAVFSDDLSTITQLPETAVVFTLGGSKDNWTLADSTGKVLGGTGAKKIAWDRGTNTWTISIDEAALATVASTNAEYGRFLYNVNNPRFTVYTSNTNNSMLLPQLYKLEGSLGTTYYTTEIAGAAPAGVTVSGAVETGTADDATIELIADGAVVASTTVSGKKGTYTLENVAAGTYTLKVTELNHVTREYTVTVAAEDLTQDVVICLLGDVNGDGRVNIGDAAKVYSHVKQTALLTDEYQLLCANVNGGKLNIGDAASLYSHVRGTKPLY